MAKSITQKLGFDASGANRSLGSLTKKLNAASQAMGQFKTTAGTKAFGGIEKGAKRGQKAVQSFTLSWKTMARIVETQLALAAFHGLINTMKDAVSTAHELGTAIEEIQTISGRTTGSAQLAEDILSVSDAIGKSALDLAEAQYQTLSNQVVEAGEALNFTSKAAKLATITASETKDAVNALSSVMNAYGKSAEETTHVASTLFKTVELGRLRLNEIANVLGRVTPLTAELGISWEEVAASIATMTRQGVRADTALTQLRAIVTKLLRPSEELSDLFRKWGVEDGKQAIEAFGGLNGVLKKMSEETGHSSSEMADLLRNVRAIAGAMGLMTNNGKDLEETLAEIEGSTTELNEQWEEFTASDAHRLTQAMNEFNNTVTRLGITILPGVRASLEAVNNFIEKQTLGWKVVLGAMDDAAVHHEIIKRAAADTVKQLDQSNEWFAERQRKRYEGLTEAAAQYYVEVQKEENALASVRDAAIDRANKAVGAQGKNIVDFYKNSTKALKKFIDDVNDQIKSNAEKIADLQLEIDERTRQKKLDGFETEYQKLNFLEQELAKQKQKFAEAFGAIDTSQESVERAIAEGEIVEQLAEQALEMAKQIGHRHKINQLEGEITSSIRNQQQVYKENDKSLRDAVPAAQELYDTQIEGEKELEQLIKQRAELYKSGALEAEGARGEEAQRQLEDINKRIVDLFKDVEGVGEFFGDEDITQVIQGMEDALNQAHKDWAAEVQLAKDAFARETIALKIALDPTGAKQQAADALGIEPFEGEAVAATARRVDEASLALLQQEELLTNQIANKRTEINGLLAGTDEFMGEGVKQTLQQIEGVNKQVGLWGILATTMGKVAGLGEAQVTVDELAVEVATRRVGEAVRLHTTLQDQLNLAREGAELTKADIQQAQQQLELSRQQGQLSDEQVSKYQRVIDALESTVQKTQEIATLDAERPEEAKLEAAKQVRSELEQQKQKQLEGANAAETMKQRIDGTRQAMSEFTESTGAATQGLNTTTNAAGNTVNTTSQIGPTAAAQVGGVNALAQAYLALAEAARQAAAAQAAAGGAATVFHGGHMRYFAQGGRSPLARGGDTIPAMLGRGETVVDAKNSRRFFSELNAIGQGSQPVYRDKGGPITNVGDISITVQGGDSSSQTVREIGHGLRRGIQRGLIKL
jgi:TP901 family phage tail tape measure protein